MANWTLILDDSFAHADTATVATPDNNTAVPTTPATGAANNWYDHVGGQFQIAGNRLKKSGGSGNSYTTTLYRGSAENSVDQRVLGTVDTSVSTATLVTATLRFDPAGGGTGSGFVFIWNKSNPAGSSLYGFTGGNYNVTISNTVSVVNPYVDGDTYTVDFSATGSSPTALSAVVTNVSKNQTHITMSGNSSTSYGQGAGAVGVGSGSSPVYWSNVKAYVGALTAPGITPSSPSNTQVRLTWGTAVGGTSPYAYQLTKCATANGTFAAIAGATTSPYTDTLGAGGTYAFYRVQVTDAASTVATSGSYGAAVRDTPLIIGLVGDSILNAQGSGQSGAYYSELQYRAGNRPVTVVNNAISGARTTDWVSGSGNMTAALAAFSAAGVDVVSLMLGANDANTLNYTSAATYVSNLTNILNTLTGAGYKVVLHSVHCPQPGGGSGMWDSRSIDLMSQYYDATPALCNGTTVLQGDRNAFRTTMNNPALLSDGLHFSPVAFHGEAIAHALGYLGATGGTTTTARTQTGQRKRGR